MNRTIALRLALVWGVGLSAIGLVLKYGIKDPELNPTVESAASIEVPTVQAPWVEDPPLAAGSAEPSALANTCFEGFKSWPLVENIATKCAYRVPANESDLPPPLVWQDCPLDAGFPAGACRILRLRPLQVRSVTQTSLSVDDAGQVELGFVDSCHGTMIELADVEGTIHAAFNTPDSWGACAVTQVAVGGGKWIAVVGGGDTEPVGEQGIRVVDHAIIGGETRIGRPNVLGRLKDEEVISLAVGNTSWAAETDALLLRGFSDGSKIKGTGGRPIVRGDFTFTLSSPGVTAIQMAKGKEDFKTLSSEPNAAIVKSDGHMIAWATRDGRSAPEKCEIVTTSLSPDGASTKLERMRFTGEDCRFDDIAVGCGRVLMGGTHPRLIRPKDRAYTTLPEKLCTADVSLCFGGARALTCSEAFFETGTNLARVKLNAFGAEKRLLAEPADAGPDASASDASAPANDGGT